MSRLARVACGPGSTRKISPSRIYSSHPKSRSSSISSYFVSPNSWQQRSLYECATCLQSYRRSRTPITYSNSIQLFLQIRQSSSSNTKNDSNPQSDGTMKKEQQPINTTEQNKGKTMEQVYKMRSILHNDATSNNDAMKDGQHQHHENNVTTTNNGWEMLWQEGLTPWDLGKPTPALHDELFHAVNGNKDITSDQKEEIFSMKSLIPGCGAGYDLATVASYHDSLMHRYLEQRQKEDLSSRIQCNHVVGLDISKTSLMYARDQVSQLMTFDGKLGDSEEEVGYSSQMSFHSSCSTEFRLGDFFKPTSQWSIVASLPAHDHGHEQGIDSTTQLSSSTESQVSLQNERFDFIFDYTFFCALDPSLRSQWGERMHQLLQPKSGRLLTLMFPILGKEAPLEGPPYPVDVSDYQRALEPHGFQIIDGPRESHATVHPRLGKELVCWWKVED